MFDSGALVTNENARRAPGEGAIREPFLTGLKDFLRLPECSADVRQKFRRAVMRITAVIRLFTYGCAVRLQLLSIWGRGN